MLSRHPELWGHSQAVLHEESPFSADRLGVTKHFLSSFPKVLKLPSAFVSRLGICRQRTASVGQSQFIQTLTLLSSPGIWEDQLHCEFPDPGTKRNRAPTDKKGLQEAWRGCHPRSPAERQASSSFLQPGFLDYGLLGKQKRKPCPASFVSAFLYALNRSEKVTSLPHSEEQEHRPNRVEAIRSKSGHKDPKCLENGKVLRLYSSSLGLPS